MAAAAEAWAEHASRRDACSEAAGSSARVLVVVPTLNEASHIDAVLQSLLRSAPTFRAFLLVVVDGGSTDQTCELVEARSRGDARIKLLRNPARVQSAGINLAARSFGRDVDVLVRCDAHAGYPPRYCERLVATLEREQADAVVVPLDSVGMGRVQRAVAWVSNSFLGTGGSAHRAGRTSGFVDHGHHAVFRMDVFRRVGGYDPTFTHNEDAELDCRQRALGGRVYLDAETRVSYRPRSTLRALAWQYFRYGAGRSRTARRHPQSVRLRQLAVPGHVVACGAALTLAPWFAASLAWPITYFTVLAGASVFCVIRERAAWALLVGPCALVMHVAWGFGFLTGLVRHREGAWRRQSTVPLWAVANGGEGP